jgi:hypothetical protein
MTAFTGPHLLTQTMNTLAIDGGTTFLNAMRWWQIK